MSDKELAYEYLWFVLNAWRAPTVREFARIAQVRSSATAQSILRRLTDKGLIVRDMA
jgi:hypothetical protein